MKKFRNEEKNGYNKDDVNQFVSYVTLEFDKLVQMINSQRNEINELRQELFLKNKDNTIIENAKTYASQIINDALIRANNMEENKNNIKKELEEIIKKQQSILNELDYDNDEQ